MKYLERYINRFCDHRITVLCAKPADITVVIPAYKEIFDDVTDTLKSLEIASLNYNGNVLVLILINYKSSDDEIIKENSLKLLKQLRQWNSKDLDVETFCLELSHKKSGVGEARKCLMDAALKFNLKMNKNGIIVNLDADTTVKKEYFNAISNYFKNNTKLEAASIAFAHNLNDINSSQIIDYELHLRIFVNMQRLMYLPFAYQTIGSAMAVKCHAYAKEGGMVKKQAGEDFYFLHKYTKNLTLGEINATWVVPSDRKSDRVPFGTGKAINDMLFSAENYNTYNYKSFEDLEFYLLKFHNNVHKDMSYVLDYQCVNSKVIIAFFKSILFKENFNRIIKNVKDFEGYLKSFYSWFDAFMLMKYLHFVRERGYENISLLDGAKYLFIKLGLSYTTNKKELLLQLRNYDIQNDYNNQWRAALMSKLSMIEASLSTHHAKRS